MVKLTSKKASKQAVAGYVLCRTKESKQQLIRVFATEEAREQESKNRQRKQVQPQESKQTNRKNASKLERGK